MEYRLEYIKLGSCTQKKFRTQGRHQLWYRGVSLVVSYHRLRESRGPQPVVWPSPLVNISVPFDVTSTDYLDPSFNHNLLRTTAYNEGVLSACSEHIPAASI